MMWSPSSALLMICSVTSLVLIDHVTSDVYFHNPRGSNNRLNERSATRNNANRLFDSQNNNRGGYNVGDRGAQPAGNNEGEQYQMMYFQSGASSSAGTELVLEWTNQHGCGGDDDTDPHKQNCNIVMQYMCQPEDVAASSASRLRDGTSTNTQDYTPPDSAEESRSEATARRAGDVEQDRGLHETWEMYDECYIRERNHGLFTADQNLEDDNGLGYSSAIYTRQNANGNRRGYECPEERDYYPYWHPTPWKDIAVLHSNRSLCSTYQRNSFNVRPYHLCVERWNGNRNSKHYSRWNNQQQCVENGGTWTEFHNYLQKATGKTSESSCTRANYIWGIPYDSADRTPECLVPLDQPECEEAPWTRSNHLGNARGKEASRYTWTLPHFPELAEGDRMKCVLRIRYNISTDDYDSYSTDSSHNQDIAAGVMSPVQQNPYVNVGAGVSSLRLAINTAQFGRTFQDRSHTFYIAARPNGAADHKIHNLNVRGKRGNIVQVYPAVEYDFIPNQLTISDQDLVHVQWTGSNTHRNGSPGGDGATGDAGEGRSGTDRSNMVQVASMGMNYPLPYEQTTMWEEATVIWAHHGNTNLQSEDVAVVFASSGYYQCLRQSRCSASAERSGQRLQNQLNNAPASFPGMLLRFSRGQYHYMCTRNNNFTNRSQKGTIIVT